MYDLDLDVTNGSIRIIDLHKVGQCHEVQCCWICHWMALFVTCKMVKDGEFISNCFPLVHQWGIHATHTRTHAHTYTHGHTHMLAKERQATYCISPKKHYYSNSWIDAYWLLMGIYTHLTLAHLKVKVMHISIANIL